jgi:signal transduction histidine kinase
MSPEPWSRLAFASASLIPWSFLGFARTYPSEGTWPPRRLLAIALITGIGFATLSTFSPLVVHDISLTSSGPERKPGPLYLPFAVFILAGSLTPLGAFWIKWRDARGQERAQLQYLGAGLLILGIGALGANLLLPLLAGHSRYSWLGPFFLVPLLALVGHAIIRHRLMDLRFVISQGLARVLITALLSFVAVVFTRIISPAPHSEVPLPLDVAVATALVLMSLSSPAQAMFARFIDPYLHRGGMHYGAALRMATHRLTRLMNPEQLSSELQEIFEAQLAPEHFALLIRRKDREEFEASDEFSRRLLPLLGLSEHLNEPSVAALALNTALINTGSNPDIGEGFHSRLRDAGIAVAVVLGRRERLGLMLLGPRKSGDAYFRDDLIFIESVAELTSISLENALLHRERVAILEYSERLLEVLDAAVVAADADGHITRYNQAARELMTLKPSSTNPSIADLPSQAAWALALALRQHWQPHDVEFVIDHTQRGRVPVIASTTILHEGRTVVGGILVITDLSTVKALAANQRRLEHLATMARFYAGIAHEIRSPLTAISNFVSLLRDRFNDPEYRETVSRLLPLEVNRIVALAERLRLMAPSEEGKLSSVDLGGLLRDIVRLQIPVGTDAAAVTLTCPEMLPRILGDPRQLTQLFLNLLNNAREAMGGVGGNITIEASSDGSARDTSVVVRVYDEGSGIEPNIIQKVFEPFFTTKVSGTGLGLSICREIAEFHGASLSLRRRDAHAGTIAEVRFFALESRTVALGDSGDGLTSTQDSALIRTYSTLRQSHRTEHQR